MKQLTVIRVTEYEEVKSDANKYPKWDFLIPENKELECVILSRKQLKSSRTNEPFMLFSIKHRKTKADYVIMPNKLLSQKLERIPDCSAVKIVFLGIVQPKGYHSFAVYNDTSFRFDPAQWPETVAPAYQANADMSGDTTVQNATGNTQGPVKQQDKLDDLPF